MAADPEAELRISEGIKPALPLKRGHPRPLVHGVGPQDFKVRNSCRKVCHETAFKFLTSRGMLNCGSISTSTCTWSGMISKSKAMISVKPWFAERIRDRECFCAFAGQARLQTRMPGWLARLIPSSPLGSRPGSDGLPKIASHGLPQGTSPGALEGSYITKARLSSSVCRTGREHPAISTRLAASSAASGETP